MDCEIESNILRDVANVQLLQLRNEEEFLSYASTARAIILWHPLKMSRLSISKLPQTSVIVRNGVGVDNVDIVAARQLGIPVCNVPDYGTEEVADHTLAMALCLWRRLQPLMVDARNGRWNWRVGESIRRVRGSIFGIVGCGRIGTATARRAAGFDFDVVFYDPFLPSGYEKALGIRRFDTLNELLERADVVSLHVTLTDATFHLVGAQELARMKPTAFLINTSRGPVVDEMSLVGALRSGKLAGAALDVVENEPRPSHDLLSLENCIVTPHAAFYSVEALRELREKSASIVLDALCGRKVRNVVNA
jgi:phosphoglycerate dehydrogenase-like enzyme